MAKNLFGIFPFVFFNTSIPQSPGNSHELLVTPLEIGKFYLTLLEIFQFCYNPLGNCDFQEIKSLVILRKIRIFYPSSGMA